MHEFIDAFDAWREMNDPEYAKQKSFERFRTGLEQSGVI